MAMLTGSLASALEREHREIDDGIAAFTAAPGDRRPLARAFRALRRHIYLEEEILFPLLSQAEPALGAPVFVMLGEHAQIWALLDSLDHDLDAGHNIGPARIRQLTSYLLHHNLKEERILYPRADEVLPGPAAGQLRAFLDSGDSPKGWVCRKARPASH
ncbi:MAG TPA: hemerythrin domain-containing protein [Trebonia sp.]|nr:hemerythrin domain-containing protein [Trebonia sp.]